MQHHKSNLRGRDECRDEPVIEFVDNLQVHIVGLPNVFVDEVEGGMCDKLVKIGVIFFLEDQERINQAPYHS